uniref:Uncharacterized protein n=1 Tax=Myotis myotis TaxID=51298 RepID=A0A7J7WVQ7_MYOMY|nr:hypothetical protein mMyoMyo1_011951 [Myotis myotis]
MQVSPYQSRVLVWIDLAKDKEDTLVLLCMPLSRRKESRDSVREMTPIVSHNMLGFFSVHINDSNKSLERMKEPLNVPVDHRLKNETNVRAIRKKIFQKSIGIDKRNLTSSWKLRKLYLAQVLSCPKVKQKLFWT